MNANSTTIFPGAGFFRFGAIAAMVAVLGIIIAQFVLTPDPPGPGIGEIVKLYADPVFQAQSLTILIQVLAMFVALVVFAVKIFPVAPGLAILACASLVLWQLLEIVPRSIDFFAFSLDYASKYVSGGDAALIEGEFQSFFVWERGLRSMRQIVWSFGLLLAGLAAWQGRGLARWVAASLFVNSLRVAVLFAGSAIGVSLPFGLHLFIGVNVAAFGLLAMWLWISPEPEQRRQLASP